MSSKTPKGGRLLIGDVVLRLCIPMLMLIQLRRIMLNKHLMNRKHQVHQSRQRSAISPRYPREELKLEQYSIVNVLSHNIAPKLRTGLTLTKSFPMLQSYQD